MTMNVKALDREYIMGTYSRFPLTLTKGKGSKVYDEEGNETTIRDYGAGMLSITIQAVSALNPDGWDNVTTPTIEASNDAIVYELHTRDLTSDSTWNGTEANRGKFLGLIEEGTTYSFKVEK